MYDPSFAFNIELIVASSVEAVNPFEPAHVYAEIAPSPALVVALRSIFNPSHLGPLLDIAEIDGF